MNGRLPRRVVAVVSLLGAGLCAGVAWAAFVATTASGGNTFQAASCFGLQTMATGSYTGNATTGRAIAVGFQPSLVMVKADTGQIAVARTDTMTGDASKAMTGANALLTLHIQSLTATGFTIGNQAPVNSGGVNYRWVAFRDGCGTVATGSYTAAAAANEAITGLGFQPELVVVMPAAAVAPVQRFAGMTTSFNLNTGTGVANAVNSLDADGFTVGKSTSAGASGAAYHWVAFNASDGDAVKSSYVGTGVDARPVTDVGFTPDYVMVRANDTVTSRSGHQRPASSTGAASQFWAATANTTNGIESLTAAGFTVGTDASVNTGLVTYHYMAFRNSNTY